MLSVRPAMAQSAAGTAIVNVASLHADSGRASSNPVTLVVAERLDCTLVRTEESSGKAVAFLLTNTGNGREAFVVAATGVGATSYAVALDSDGDGRFDAVRDAPLADGATPVLAPGAAVRLFIPLDEHASATLAVTARAATGAGAPGTLLAGRGDGGSDAVVGLSGGAASLALDLADTAAQPPTITQSQAVLAPDGGTMPRRGASVTYTLIARFPAATPAASIVDPIPAGTAYRPASLALDGAALADADHVTDGRVVVSLGAVAAGSVHRLSFTVVIP